jgi:hypothetical protein
MDSLTEVPFYGFPRRSNLISIRLKFRQPEEVDLARRMVVWETIYFCGNTLHLGNEHRVIQGGML